MSQRQDIKKGTTRAKNLREARRGREIASQKERHEKRAKQHMRRREPLVEVQEEEEEKPLSVKSKREKQTERLRAWQKARDERKRQEKLNKKEPFRFMLTRPFYLDPVDKSASAANETQSKQKKCDVERSGPVTRSRSGKLPSSKISSTSSMKMQPSSTRRAKQPTRKEASQKQLKSTNAETCPSQLSSQVSPKPAPPSEPSVEDPAWIPGATISAQSVPVSAKTFDEVFGDSKVSSPFLFSGSNSSSRPVDFNFLKLPKSPSTNVREMSATLNNTAGKTSDDSLNDEEHVSYTRLFNDSMDECSNSQRNKEKDKSTERQDTNAEQSSVEKERMKADENAEHPVTKPEQNSVEKKRMKKDNSTDKQTRDSCDVDLSYFRKLYSDVEKEFQLLCELWNKKLDDLDCMPSEQVTDQIRTTVCQAQLLVRSKMRQYLGLVEKAEDTTAACKTTAEDLQGFWDMVYYQVIDIRNKFDELTKLEENNWQQLMQPSSPVISQPRRSKRKAIVSKPVAAPSEKLIAARQKREAERKRMREQMAALKKSKVSTQEPSTPERAAQSNQDEEASVYSTPPSCPPPCSSLSSTRRRSSARRRKV